MRHRVIIDSGPGLNFFSINQERIVTSVLGRLSAPEAVKREITNKSETDHRFAHALQVLRKMQPNYLEILSDDSTPELNEIVERISGFRLEERVSKPKDLGELMVIAHAVVTCEKGKDVIIFIDEGDGTRTAQREAQRLMRLRAKGSTQVGSIRLVSTITVLEKAAGGTHIQNRATMRELYGRLRGLDDGLPPLKDTRLMNLPCWEQH